MAWTAQRAHNQVTILTARFNEQSKQMSAMSTELSELKASEGGDGKLSGGPKYTTGKGL